MVEVAQILIGGLLQGSIFALLALGFSLVFRVTGVVNLSQGAFAALGALTMYSLQVDLGWPLLPAGLAALAGTTLAGLLLAWCAFVPALSRLPNSGILMVTAGLLTLLEGLALVVWGSQPYALPPFSGERPVSLFGLRLVSQGIWIAGAAAAIVLALWYVLARTALGRALRACAENPMAARLMGIDVPLMTALSFSLAALIAAVGGIAVAPITALQFDTGRLFTVSGFIAVAIGGIGSFRGAVVGGLLLGVIEQMATAYVSSLFGNALALGLLLAALLWRPNGLFSSGPTRRQDVREEPRLYKGMLRIAGRDAWAGGVAAAVALLAIPLLVSDQALLRSLVITGILFIAVLGLDVLMGYAGQVSLGQAGFMAIGGYTAAYLSTRFGIAPLVGTLAGAALSLACALVLALATMRLRGLYLALATLAFGLLADSLAVGLSEVTGGPSGLVGIPAFSLGGYAFDSPRSMYYLVAGLIVVLVVLLAGGMRFGFGRALRAIRSDQLAAGALGIHVARHKMAAFAISAVLASLSGSLYAHFFRFLSPDMVGMPRSFEMLAMLVIGGEGTLAGPLLGVALLTLLPTAIQPLAIYKTLASGALLVLAFLFFPQGLIGAIAQAWDRLRRTLSPAGRTLGHALAGKDTQ